MKFKRASGPVLRRPQGLPDPARRAQDRRRLGWRDRADRPVGDVVVDVQGATHPIFRDQLDNSDGRIQRRRTLEQMRAIVNDPGAPQAEHFPVR